MPVPMEAVVIPGGVDEVEEEQAIDGTQIG